MLVGPTLISLINVESTLTDFEKFHPPQKKSILHVYWFLRFFPPSTPRLLELCISFFHKIPPSTFIPTSTFSGLANFAPPPRLFQRLLVRWEYSLLNGWSVQKISVQCMLLNPSGQKTSSSQFSRQQVLKHFCPNIHTVHIAHGSSVVLQLS